MAIFPRASVLSAMRKYTDKRVSATAADEVDRLLEDMISRIMKHATILADYSGRKTVMWKDIVVAYSIAVDELNVSRG